MLGANVHYCWGKRMGSILCVSALHVLVQTNDSLAVSQVQINNDMKDDTFTELPVSLVLFSLICIDVVERIRHCRLTGQGEPIAPNTNHSYGAIDPELSSANIYSDISWALHCRSSGVTNTDPIRTSYSLILEMSRKFLPLLVSQCWIDKTSAVFL